MDRIEGNVGDEGATIAIGKGITQTVRQGGPEWRWNVKHDLESLERRTMILLWCVLIIFVAGAIMTAATIRQFDIHWQQIERLERIERARPFNYDYPRIP